MIYRDAQFEQCYLYTDGSIAMYVCLSCGPSPPFSHFLKLRMFASLTP